MRYAWKNRYKKVTPCTRVQVHKALGGRSSREVCGNMLQALRYADIRSEIALLAKAQGALVTFKKLLFFLCQLHILRSITAAVLRGGVSGAAQGAVRIPEVSSAGPGADALGASGASVSSAHTAVGSRDSTMASARSILIIRFFTGHYLLRV